MVRNRDAMAFQKKGLHGMTSAPEALPDAKGAYLLLIEIGRPVELPRRFADQVLGAGRYGYAGSAYGPGGIRARCRRHLEGPTTLRWHIDWLTRASHHVRVVPLPGEAECRLIEALVRSLDVRFPIEGFGSTDCKLCRAHLVEFGSRCSFDDVAEIFLPDSSTSQASSPARL
jgi:Uri superfamily endonuclease